jgi:probable phosphoglycerate mutase
MPGGESALDVRSRFLPAVAGIVDGVSGGDVLLVSHGAAIRMAAAALLGETVETFYIPNAGLVVLRRDGGQGGVGAGWTLESWDRADPVRGDVTAGGVPY